MNLLTYPLPHIARIIDAPVPAGAEGLFVEQILLDSRKLVTSAGTLFFALKGPRRDGHPFIAELYRKGVRCFVISNPVEKSFFPDAVFLEVYDTLAALQALVAHHRKQFNLPVIGITGSNGKTIVKEWLYQLLHTRFQVIRSPRSFNSQIGVPLSVWPMNEQHTLGIFEAGISEQGEMIRLERIIQPGIGVLTNIGEAHSEGFIDHDHKFREKLILFRNCEVIIGRESDFEYRSEALDMLGADIRLMTWGEGEGNYFRVLQIEPGPDQTHIRLQAGDTPITFTIPFVDQASVENAITCVCVLHYLGISPEEINTEVKKLHPVNMRLELKRGINHCTLINDSYSADTSSLDIALNFLDQQNSGSRKTAILSDFLQSALPDEELYGLVLEKIRKHQVHRLIGIGGKISSVIPALLEEGETLQTQFYPSTTDFIRDFMSSRFREESILVKGARVFEFEKIVQLLEQQAHQTLMEINLSAILHNLREYQKCLAPATRIMAMVKAFAYGSGGTEIARVLQYHKVDYLGVAYADEGVELRKAGIGLPVMVMNPEISAFDKITEYNLEPELYSFEITQAFVGYLDREGYRQYPVHIELETGMNRLGFDTGEIEKLAKTLKATDAIRVVSVFTHLAASEDPAQDNFTREQYERFRQATDRLQELTGADFLRHISNSAAVIRHPDMQLDMVRLGIGLYGIDSAASGKLSLQTVATLRSTIAQLKKLKPGESVSYGRAGVVNRNSLIATVRLGYADGFPRRLGNGVGRVLVQGVPVPVIGTVCMDMFMIDVTDIPSVEEGNEVIIFGKDLPVTGMAEQAGTIAYEIMTGISQRVRRVYYEE